MRILVLLLALTSLVCGDVRATDPQPDHPSTSDARLLYLLFVDRSREAGVQLEHAKAESASAIDCAERDLKLFKMSTALYQRNNLAAVDFERSRRQWEFSVANRDALAQAVVFLTEGIKANQLQAKLLQGQWVDETEIKKAYIAEWNAQCLYQKKAVEAAQARVAFADFEARVARNLYKRNAAPYEEILNKDHSLLEAKEKLEAEKRGDALCYKNLPSFFVPPSRPAT